MSQEDLAKQIVTIAVAAGDEKSRIVAVLAACEAAEKAGMAHYEVLGTLVASFVATSGALMAATINALIAADHPADGRFTQ